MNNGFPALKSKKNTRIYNGIRKCESKKNKKKKYGYYFNKIAIINVTNINKHFTLQTNPKCVYVNFKANTFNTIFFLLKTRFKKIVVIINVKFKSKLEINIEILFTIQEIQGRLLAIKSKAQNWFISKV